jgi:hypothetical protein
MLPPQLTWESKGHWSTPRQRCSGPYRAGCSRSQSSRFYRSRHRTFAGLHHWLGETQQVAHRHWAPLCCWPRRRAGVNRRMQARTAVRSALPALLLPSTRHQPASQPVRPPATQPAHQPSGHLHFPLPQTNWQVAGAHLAAGSTIVVVLQKMPRSGPNPWKQAQNLP